jgi:hypothetical protein
MSIPINTKGRLTYIPVDKLDEYKKKLEKEIKRVEHEIKEKEKIYSPDIRIYLDEIGTETHFDDGFVCRDFSDDKRLEYFQLMVCIAEHRWKDAVECLKDYFIDG